MVTSTDFLEVFKVLETDMGGHRRHSKELESNVDDGLYLKVDKV